MKKEVLLLLEVFFVHTLVLIGFFHTGLLGELVFFYRGLFYIGCVSVLFFISLHCLKKYVSISRSTIVAVVCTFMSVHSMFFVLVPVTLERSISVFMLRTMAAHPQEVLTKKQMEKAVLERYILKQHAVEKRFIEQQQSGTIAPYTNGYQVTHKGIWIVRLFELVGKVFGISVPKEL